MTTELRETFAAVTEAAGVPPIDRVGFERRLRSARRRRTTVRAAVAVAAVAAVTLGTVGVRTVLPEGAPDSAGPAGTTPAATRPSTVAVAIDHRLATVTADGTLHRSRIPVEELLGLTPQGAVVSGRDSEALLVPLDARGRPGRPVRLVDGPVQRLEVSPDGTRIAWVDLQNRLHVRPVAPAARELRVLALDAEARLLAVDGRSVLVEEADPGRIVVRTERGRVTLDDPELGFGGAMAGGVVAYQTEHGASFYDADGTRRVGEVGGAIGALSPDGRWYATAPDDAQIDSGMLDSVWVEDTSRDSATPGLDGYHGHGTAQQISWVDDDRFLVVGSEGSVPGGTATLLDCSRTARDCEVRYTDRTGTLAIPTR